MKKFKGLFYTGLILVLMPIIVSIVVFYFSYNSGKKIKEKEEKKQIVYDTVTVKIYDTVVVEKIKYIKKVKSETDSLKN
jgi:hypothetical protein